MTPKTVPFLNLLGLRFWCLLSLDKVFIFYKYLKEYICIGSVLVDHLTASVCKDRNVKQSNSLRLFFPV